MQNAPIALRVSSPIAGVSNGSAVSFGFAWIRVRVRVT
jgi:hypothetical protein